MTDQTYNGWTNYETWNVNLWLTNDEGFDGLIRDLIDNCADASEPYELAEALKDYVRESAPDLGASMFADLLGAALDNVNWNELAECYLQDHCEA